MPSPNIIKTYLDDSYYHLYNRGVEKRQIFLDEQDYKTYLSYLKFYLSSPPLRGETPKYFPSQQLCNHSQQVTLLAYCLMPNHFHLMLRQYSLDGIDHFMRSMSTKYARYFNTRYQRVGHLFQGTYKAVRVTSEEQFTYLTKYIHRNPLELPEYRQGKALAAYKYSSYPNYLGIFYQPWIKTEDVLSYFSRTNPTCSYPNFVEEADPDDVIRIIPYAIDT